MMDDLPAIGHVISHGFLWKREAEQGREEGWKDRPCVIVRVQELEGNERRVFVAPITHTAPAEKERAVEIPAATKRRLGLDDERSWLVTTELNHFLWPGYDVRPTPDGRERYGTLSGSTLRSTLEQIATNIRDRTLRMVDRDDEQDRARLNELRERGPSLSSSRDRGNDDRER